MIFFLILLLSGSDTFLPKKSVEVYKIEKDNVLEIHAKNSNPHPVTIELKLDIKNLKPNENLPYIGVLASHSDSKIMELEYINKNEGWDINASYIHYTGDIYARHNDSFAYRLPYPKGETYTVDQGFGGKYSHQGALQHALDFNMPKGSEIYAARGGTVAMMKEDSRKGGDSEDMMEFANFITILHDDGTFADYAHLKYIGVEVKVGQKVRPGQLIGYSGATGYASGPHLHLVVKKAKRGGGFISIPIKFSTQAGIEQLEEGKAYIGY